MYSENNRRAAYGRANDELLRRMLGGGAIPFMQKDAENHPPLPDYSHNKFGCDGAPQKEDTAPSCNICPTNLHAPSLAMVYAPRQCWRKLLKPEAGLKEGSIFAELILPLEVIDNIPMKGGQKPFCK